MSDWQEDLITTEAAGTLDGLFEGEPPVEAFFIFDGTTGETLFTYEGHASATLFEYPIIADVDADGAAEILLAKNA